MSFYDIKDLKKIDETIKQYLATMKRIKNHNMQDRREMSELWEPVIDSNKEMAKDIVKDF